MTILDLVIIGGGFSGVCHAYFAHQYGLDFALYEAQNSFGGVIKSKYIQGVLSECGANTLRAGNILQQMLKELHFQHYTAQVSKKALVCHRHELTPPRELFNRQLFFQILQGLFKNNKIADDVTLADFVRETFGDEFLEKFVHTFVAGIYAGDTERLLLRTVFPRLYGLKANHYNLFNGLCFGERPPKKAKAKIISFDGGLQAFIEDIAQYIHDNSQEKRLFKKSPVSSISRDSQGHYNIQFDGQANMVKAKNVIIATNAHHAAKLYPELLSPLENIYYSPIITVTCQIPRDSCTSQTLKHISSNLGFLCSRTNNLDILGCLHNSTMFPKLYLDHAQKFTITVFMGGTGQEQLLQRNDGELVAMAKQNLITVYKLAEHQLNQIYILNLSRQPAAIPQYTKEHSDILKKTRENLINQQIGLAGNYLEGLSLESLAEQAKTHIQQIKNIK